MGSIALVYLYILGSFDDIRHASEGGSGTPVPALSIEVEDVETALVRVKNAGIPIEYGPESEPWGVRRFFVRDPFGKLINILQHE